MCEKNILEAALQMLKRAAATTQKWIQSFQYTTGGKGLR